MGWTGRDPVCAHWRFQEGLSEGRIATVDDHRRWHVCPFGRRTLRILHLSFGADDGPAAATRWDTWENDTPRRAGLRPSRAWPWPWLCSVCWSRFPLHLGFP